MIWRITYPFHFPFFVTLFFPPPLECTELILLDSTNSLVQAFLVFSCLAALNEVFLPFLCVSFFFVVYRYPPHDIFHSVLCITTIHRYLHGIILLNLSSLSLAAIAMQTFMAALAIVYQFQSQSQLQFLAPDYHLASK